MNTRNSPCPCQSGKKHKKCCGSEIELKKKRDAKWERLRAERAARIEAARLKREKLNKESPVPFCNANRIHFPLSALLVLPAFSLGRK